MSSIDGLSFGNQPSHAKGGRAAAPHGPQGATQQDSTRLAKDVVAKVSPGSTSRLALDEEEHACHDELWSEHNRHASHHHHACADLAKLSKESPHLAESLMHLIAQNPRLRGRSLKAMVSLALAAPALANQMFTAIMEHPSLGKPLIAAMPKIAEVHARVLAALMREFPQLSERSLARIAESSLCRGLGQIIPGVGVGIAAWGAWDTAKALADPALSAQTKTLYAVANSMDWGAALGGLVAATGVGEAAALAASASSLFLYARAEASKEIDRGATHER